VAEGHRANVTRTRAASFDAINARPADAERLGDLHGADATTDDMTTVFARSIYDRLPASVGDADASYRDLTFANCHGLSARRGEPIAD